MPKDTNTIARLTALITGIALLTAVSTSRQEHLKFSVKGAWSDFMDRNFELACRGFSYLKNTKGDSRWQVRLGWAMSCFEHGTIRQEALTELRSLYTEGKSDRDRLILYYLGRAWHSLGKCDSATVYYQLFREQAKTQIASMYVGEVNLRLFQCHTALAEKAQEEQYQIVILKMDTPLNSFWHEYAPATNTTETQLLFTSRREGSIGGRMSPSGRPDKWGEFFEDVFISRRTTEGWTKPENITVVFNTRGHDATAGMDPTLRHLFIYKSDAVRFGDIYLSMWADTGWTTPAPLPPSVNSEFLESSAALSPDGKVLYFVSNRPDGFGMRDIYISVKGLDGWQTPTNASEKVNTPYNEEAPYISRNGRRLYFASQGHTSKGGYDLFYIELHNGIPTGRAVRLPEPLNSPDDDVFISITASGRRFYFSSNRQGWGGFDLYQGYATGMPLEPPEKWAQIEGQISNLGAVGSDKQAVKVLLIDSREGEVVDEVMAIPSAAGESSFAFDVPYEGKWAIVVKGELAMGIAGKLHFGKGDSGTTKRIVVDMARLLAEGALFPAWLPADTHKCFAPQTEKAGERLQTLLTSLNAPIIVGQEAPPCKATGIPAVKPVKEEVAYWKGKLIRALQFNFLTQSFDEFLSTLREKLSDTAIALLGVQLPAPPPQPSPSTLPSTLPPSPRKNWKNSTGGLRNGQPPLPAKQWS